MRATSPSWGAGGTCGGSQFVQQSDAIGFAHADGVLIQDCVVRDVPSAHAIELNAVRRARVVNCLFDGVHVVDDGTQTPVDREAVQITGATGQGNLPAPAYDNTPCQDILITGCTMRSSLSSTRPFGALCGDHVGAQGVTHRGIRVLGNHVESSSAYGIRATDWRQSVIAGNTIESAAITGIYLNSPTGNGITDITVTGNSVHDTGAGGAIVVSNSTGRNDGITISHNVVRAVTGETGVYVGRTDNATITGNTIAVTRHPSGGNCQGIQIQASPHAVVTGNQISDIQGDGIGVDSGSTGTLIAQNTVIGTTGHGIAAGSTDIALRDNHITGANSAGSGATYALRIGGNAANVSCRGNVVRKGDGSATAAVAALPGCTGTWITGNDLRGWGADSAVVDSATGTITSANAV